MNCEDFENSVNDLAREQLMETGIRAQALVHRDECPACAQRLAEESALSFKLRVLAADSRSAVVPPLGNEVLAALRERQAPMSRKANRAQPRFRATTVAATATAAAAALILVVLAFAFMRAGSPPPTGSNNLPGDNANVKTPEFVAGPSPVLPVRNPATGVPSRNIKRVSNRAVASAKAAARRDRKGVVTTEAATSVTASYAPEVTTDFFPVGYGSAPSLGDGGQVVRVELPRSALVAFGVPMNVDRYNEKVKADVLFGADGMAHAIRFVQ